MKLIIDCDARYRRWWQVRRPHRWVSIGRDRAANRVYSCRSCGVAGVS